MASFTETNNKQSTFSSSTFITKDIEITGNFKGKGSLQIEGTVNGDINVNSVVIGESGRVNGNIVVKNLQVTGSIEGEIIVSELLEVCSRGSVIGDIAVNQIKIHEGGKIIGSMNIYKKED